MTKLHFAAQRQKPSSADAVTPEEYLPGQVTAASTGPLSQCFFANKPLFVSLTFLKTSAVRVSETAFEHLATTANDSNDFALPRWQPKNVVINTDRAKFEATRLSPLTSVAATDLAFRSIESNDDVLVVLLEWCLVRVSQHTGLHALRYPQGTQVIWRLC